MVQRLTCEGSDGVLTLRCPPPPVHAGEQTKAQDERTQDARGKMTARPAGRAHGGGHDVGKGLIYRQSRVFMSL